MASHLDKPIRLFWWDKRANFGDAISPMIVAHVAGRPVEWAAPEDAEIFAIGSIMNFVAKAVEVEGRQPWVWGTGVIGLGTEMREGPRFAAVRGPRTARDLKLSNIPFGDPGILISDVLPRAEATGRVGIVPHFSQIDAPEIADLVAAIPDAELIDVRNDATRVVGQISGCRAVISSSLHGLVVADSYGVPNIWLDGGRIHRAPKFKFRDYAMGFGRDLSEPIPIKEAGAALAALPVDEIPYAESLAEARAKLRAAFPIELAAH